MSDARYAILGDIHGNWEALCAVLGDAGNQGVTNYACVGDVVGYNANPVECLEKIRELQCAYVRGNHDHYCCCDEDLEHFHPLAAEVIKWTRDRLSSPQIEWLRERRYRQVVENFTIVHATLDMPEKWGYVFDELDALTNFNYQITPVCFHGHTHVPVVFRHSGRIETMKLDKLRIERGHKYFVNVGSIGQPRDGDPRAAYVIYDLKRREIELRRVPYDIGAVQEKILAANLPEWLAERLAIGK